MTKVTKSFKTQGGHTVNVTGIFDEETLKTTLDVTVEGIGRQGGIPAPSRFSKDGIDYTHIVGKLPLTAEQAELIFSVWQEIKDIKSKDLEVIAIRAEMENSGTYEDVEQKHSWMKNTY